MSDKSEFELYQPSSGIEGDAFMQSHCYKCIKFPDDSNAKGQCEIVLASMAFDIDDKRYPKQWRYQDGAPTCTAFKDRDKTNAERRKKKRSKPKYSSTIDMWED